MQKIKIFTRSLGCPKNLVDTENILGGFGHLYEPASDIASSHVVLINTCAFIQPAVEESLEVIFSSHEELKNLDKKPMLVVTGCLVSRYGSGLGAEIPEADIYLNIDQQRLLPGLILDRLGQNSNKLLPARKKSTPPGYAYLKISEGCNNRCSFCTIPSIRGKLKSSSLDSIVAEAGSLLGQGVKELILVAQDSTAYGRDLKNQPGLARLVQELCSLDGLQWLRIMYLYPSGISRKLLEDLARIQGPFIPYFDVPFQHSHPDILRKMGRPFKENPATIIKRIRQFFPEACLRTTLITGYPGETDEHFAHLLAFVRQAGLQHLGVFPFYPEQGVAAADFSGQVPEEVRRSRAQIIMKEQKKISRTFLAGFEDSLMQILVDTAHPEWPGLYKGRSWFQAPDIDGITYISGPDVKPGEMIRAGVREATDYDLIALQT